MSNVRSTTQIEDIFIGALIVIAAILFAFAIVDATMPVAPVQGSPAVQGVVKYGAPMCVPGVVNYELSVCRSGMK